ncbi:MAG: VPLPA-CTERM sorting domain-containing protein, partial [Pseudomonadota bacterium]
DAIPALQGKYIFGDFARDGFFSPSGRLFVADLDAPYIEELSLPFATFVKSFGIGPDGEIYLLAGENVGPFVDTNGELLGRIYRIDAVPLPAAMWMLMSAFGLLAVIRRRRPG